MFVSRRRNRSNSRLCVLLAPRVASGYQQWDSGRPAIVLSDHRKQLGEIKSFPRYAYIETRLMWENVTLGRHKNCLTRARRRRRRYGFSWEFLRVQTSYRLTYRTETRARPEIIISPGRWKKKKKKKKKKSGNCSIACILHWWARRACSYLLVGRIVHEGCFHK